MTVLIIDVEATGAQRNKAHPFDNRNRLTHIGVKPLEQSVCLYEVEYSYKPFGESLRTVQDWIGNSRLLVGANIKFDLHWLSRYGIDLHGIKVFDLTVAFFILRGQKNPYPSLDQMAEYYGVEKKLDVVKLEYWDKGFDTDEVPQEILEEYLAQDLLVTELVYKKMAAEIATSSPDMVRTIQLAMYDLLVLQECEENGMLYDKEASIQEGDRIEKELIEEEEDLKKLLGYDWFSSTSYQKKSVMLFGGTLEFKEKVKYPFTYKDGRTIEKEKWGKVEKTFQGFFSPKLGTPLAEEGFYSTDESNLVTLLEQARGKAKEVITRLLSMAKKEKKRSTYYHGFPKQINHFNWENNVIHTTLNQVVAATGRLSSSKPNIQNIEGGVKEMFKSRFKIRV